LFFEVINTSYRCIDVVVILSRHQSKRALNWGSSQVLHFWS
jgi:hypothetical protein